METKPALTAITVARVDGECILGRPDLGLFVAVPEPGGVFVETLQSGATLEEATRRATAVAGEEVDGNDFVVGLTDAGFFEPPQDAGTDGSAGAGPSGRRIRWIEGVNERTARPLFGRTAWTVYGLAAVVVIVMWSARPELRPSFEQAWWLPDPILSILVLTPVVWGLRGVHEAWHWLAGRAVGVPATFRLSYRGVFLVFETDLSQIVSIDRRRRYSPFLAGMAIDVLVVAVILGIRSANVSGLLTLPGWLDRLLAAVVLAQFLGIAWQFFGVFLRSDMYAVVANALRCHDLYRATWLTTKDRLWRLDGRELAEFAAMGARDRQVAKWFGVFYLQGLLTMTWLVLYFAVPFLIGLVSWLGASLLRPDVGTWAFWSSVGVVLLVLGQRLAPIPLALRERRLRQKGQLR